MSHEKGGMAEGLGDRLKPPWKSFDKIPRLHWRNQSQPDRWATYK